MQCYCRIRVGSNYNWDGKVYKTKVSPHKTNNPEWRSTFSISIKNPTKYYIRILVKDKFSIMDKLIGEAMFPLGDSSLLRDQENIITVPIKKAGGVKGQLMLSVIPHTFGTGKSNFCFLRGYSCMFSTKYRDCSSTTTTTYHCSPDCHNYESTTTTSTNYDCTTTKRHL